MVIELSKYRKPDKFISEEEVLEMICDLSSAEMLIVTNVEGTLRVIKVRASRFQVNPEEFENEQ